MIAKEILGIGHSHLAAIAAATRRSDISARHGLEIGFVQLRNRPEFEAEFQAVALRRTPRTGAEIEKLTAMLKDAIGSSTSACALAFSCLGGNAHNALGLINHPRPFDFVLPEEPELPLAPGHEPVPLGVVSEALRERMTTPLDMLRIVRALVDCPMVHCEAPPPIPSDHVEKNPGVFRERATKFGVAPPSLRYKLWRLQSAIFREVCADADIRFLPAPTEAVDATGFLVSQAWTPDATHANGWYGERVVEQIAALLSEPAAMENKS